MSDKKTTAGKTAKSKTSAKWRTVRIKGKRALRSPEGRIYYGTAAEVRDANLYPWRRKSLAESIRLYRFCFSKGSIGNEDFAEICAECRRDAIMSNRSDSLSPNEVNDRRILAIAAARYWGESVEDMIADAIDGSISATMDHYHSDTGEWSLPLTRQEAAALKSDIRDWSDSAKCLGGDA